MCVHYNAHSIQMYMYAHICTHVYVHARTLIMYM